MKRIALLLAAGLVAPAFPALADGVTIDGKIAYDANAPVRDAIKAECGLETLLSQALVEFGRGSIKAGDTKTAKGKVFDGKITGVWATGGPWGGASIRVDGKLMENGKVIGSVASRRNTTRGGYGACGKIHVSARKVAEDIAGWMKAPTMDAALGDIKDAK